MEGCRHQYSRLLMVVLILFLALVFPSSSLPATRRFQFNVSLFGAQLSVYILITSCLDEYEKLLLLFSFSLFLFFFFF